jgi:hypothetical protein
LGVKMSDLLREVNGWLLKLSILFTADYKFQYWNSKFQHP